MYADGKSNEFAQYILVRTSPPEMKIEIVISMQAWDEISHKHVRWILCSMFCRSIFSTDNLRQWMFPVEDDDDGDQNDGYWFYGLFIFPSVVFFFFLPFTHWSTPSKWKSWWKQINNDDNKFYTSKVKKNWIVSWASITLSHCGTMCFLCLWL